MCLEKQLIELHLTALLQKGLFLHTVSTGNLLVLVTLT